MAIFLRFSKYLADDIFKGLRPSSDYSTGPRQGDRPGECKWIVPNIWLLGIVMGGWGRVVCYREVPFLSTNIP
jgi:hypothetical protein